MRAEQKIIMSCRQTGDRAERLLEWLDQSRMMLRAQDRALRIEVRGIANELLSVVEAVEQPPTAGLIGAWGSARAELVGALMDDGPQSTPAEDERRLSLGRDRIMTLLPRDTEGGAAARIRFVAADRAEAPFRFPIRVSLLGQLDLVKILAGAYSVHVPPERQRLPSPDTITASLTAKAQEVVHQAFSGMSRRDIDTLRDTLHAIAPESRSLRELDAGGYWDMLGGLIPHLPEVFRRRAFALLWGEDPAITTLFETLSDALELLGFSGEVFTGLDALLGRDPATGWMIRHEDSIIATKTICSGADRPGRTIRVSSRHGRATDIERFLLASLADEVRLPVDPSQLSLLETGDVVVLAAPRPVMLWPDPRAGSVAARPGRHCLSAAEALEIFAAQKASHQIDHAVRRHTLTSLLIAADFIDRDGGTEIDATSTAQIANWIEITQGDTPHARERQRTGIAILVGEGARAGLASDPVASGAEGETRLTATIAAVLDGNADWANEWTPNRPFRNVFTWRPPRAVILPEPAAGQPGSADILRFERTRSTEVAGASPQLSELTLSHDLANLRHAVAQATNAATHTQQLSARLADLRRALSARFLRLHSSNDPSGAVEWRRQICHVARNRLQKSAQRGGFGRLQRALMFTEGEALAVLARLKADDPRTKAVSQAPDLRTPDLRTTDAARVVEACLEAWIAAMRQGTRSPTLMRAIGVPGHIVSHMVDELVIGALRIGLQEKLAEAVRRIQLSAARAVDCDNSVAALMERGINAYVETLDPSARQFRSSVHRDARFGAPMGVPTGAGLPARGQHEAGRVPHGAAARRPGQTSALTIADDWAETFADLIEANILGASLLGGAGHLNRELGEVLAAISAGPFEGFQ